MRRSGPVVAVVALASVALAALVVVAPRSWLGLAGRSGSGATDAAVLGRTNVVVAIGCTFRADQTTPYGGPDTTPFLATLAAEGARFDDTISNAPWTKAATTSLVSGQYALDLAVNAPGRKDDQALPPEAITIAERFHDAGYATVGGTANPNNNAVFGFHQGFDHYFEATGLWRDEEVKVRGDVVVDDVLAHLPADRPFYAQVLLVDAHFPYDLGPVAVAAWKPFSPTPHVAQYRAMLGQLDTALQRLWDGLVARGVADDTVFVVIGDHGEGLYLPEHHGVAHGFYLYPSTLHVPFLARGPGIPAGTVVTGLSQSVDLQPTLAGLLGLPPRPDEAEATPPQDRPPGRDWSALLRAGGGATDTTAVFSDTWFRNANRASVYTADRACMKDFHPLLRRGAPPFPTACFDRRADPDFATPIADEALMQQIVDWRAVHEGRRAAFVAAHGEPTSAVDDVTHDALKGLGYVE